MSETAADRPWWADVQHLRPEDGVVAPTRDDAATKRPPSRFHRRPGVTTAVGAPPRVEAEVVQRPAPDFDFDIGLASLLDPPAEEPGRFEWIDLSDEPERDAIDWLALEEAARPEPAKPLDARTAELTADDRASGWRSDVWDIAKPAAATPVRRHAPRTATERLVGSPDRIALYAFVLGLVLIALAALGAPAADAAI